MPRSRFGNSYISHSLQYFQTNRHRNFDFFTRRRELSSLGITAENHHVIAVLVSNKHPFSRWVYHKITGRFTINRLMTYESELPCFFVNTKNY